MKNIKDVEDVDEEKTIIKTGDINANERVTALAMGSNSSATMGQITAKRVDIAVISGNTTEKQLSQALELFKENSLNVVSFIATEGSQIITGDLIIDGVPVRTPQQISSKLETLYRSKLDKQSNYSNALRYYISLDASKTPLPKNTEKQTEQRMPLHENCIQPFLESPQTPLLLLQGDSGAGKSIYIHWLALRLWDLRKKDVNGFIPIVIEMKFLELKPHQKNLGRFIEAVLMHDYGFTTADINTLMSLRVLFVFDGFEEKQGDNYNIYEANQLINWKNAKAIVTCRTQFTNDIQDYKVYFNNLNFNCLEYYISSFTKNQIDAYIQAWPKDSLSLEDYTLILNENDGLYDLVENPLLLYMVMSALPEIIEEYDLEKINKNLHPRVMFVQPFTRASIFSAFIRHWFEVEMKRLGDARATLWNVHINTKEAFSLYCEDLAWEMFTFADDNTLLEIEYKEPSARAKMRGDFHDSPWHKFFTSDEDAAVKKVRNGCPLRCFDKKFSFYHKSFLEYFIALKIYNEMFEDDISSEKVLEKLVGLSLNKKLLRSEPGALQFLAEMLESDRNRCELFINVILSSGPDKLGDAVKIAASNAIMVLTKCTFNFSGLEFIRVNLTGADIRGGYFDRTNFFGSDLTDVLLNNAWLRLAILKECRLKGTMFGKYPYPQQLESVRSIVYRPDKNLLVTACGDDLLVWNLGSYEITHVFRGHTDLVSSLSINDDATLIASGSADRTVRIWNLETKQSIVLRAHKGKVTSVSFSGNGRSLASCGEDKTVRVWDLETGEVMFLNERTHKVNSVSFSSDGQWLATGGSDCIVRVWDLINKEVESFDRPAEEWQRKHGKVYGVYLSSDGNTLAALYDHLMTVRVKNATGNWTVVIKEYGATKNLHLLNNGKWVASGNRAWEVCTGKMLVFDGDKASRIESVYLSHVGDTLVLASGHSDGTVHIDEMSSGQSDADRYFHTEVVTSICGTRLPDKLDKTMKIWDVMNNEYTLLQYRTPFVEDEKAVRRIWKVGNTKAILNFDDRDPFKYDGLRFLEFGRYCKSSGLFIYLTNYNQQWWQRVDSQEKYWQLKWSSSHPNTSLNLVGCDFTAVRDVSPLNQRLLMQGKNAHDKLTTFLEESLQAEPESLIVLHEIVIPLKQYYKDYANFQLPIFEKSFTPHEDCFKLVKVDRPDNDLYKVDHVRRIDGHYTHEDIFHLRSETTWPGMLLSCFKDKNLKRILIVGRTGTGKTSYCHYLAKKWSKIDRLDYNYISEILIYIPLRYLHMYQQHIDPLEGGLQHTEQLTADNIVHFLLFFLSNEHPDDDSLWNESAAALWKTQLLRGANLWLLDGLDETEELIPGTLAYNILNQFLLTRENCILISKPHTAARRKDIIVDVIYELLGFQDIKIAKYIKDKFELNRMSDSYDNAWSEDAEVRFLTRTYQCPVLWNAAHSPLYLALMCDLQNVSKRFDVQEWTTQTALFHSLIYGILTRFKKELDRTSLVVFDTKLGQFSAYYRLLDFCSDEKMLPLPNIVNCLGELAFTELLAGHHAIDRKTFDKIIVKHQGSLKEYLKSEFEQEYSIFSCQNLFCNSGFIIRKFDAYYFLDLKFKEYFAAYFIAQVLKKKAVFAEAIYKNKRYEDIKKLLLSMKGDIQLNVFWKFLAGIARDDDEVLNVVLESLLNESGLMHEEVMRNPEFCSVLVNCLGESFLGQESHRLFFESMLSWCIKTWNNPRARIDDQARVILVHCLVNYPIVYILVAKPMLEVYTQADEEQLLVGAYGIIELYKFCKSEIYKYVIFNTNFPSRDRQLALRDWVMLQEDERNNAPISILFGEKYTEGSDEIYEVRRSLGRITGFLKHIDKFKNRQSACFNVLRNGKYGDVDLALAWLSFEYEQSFKDLYDQFSSRCAHMSNHGLLTKAIKVALDKKCLRKKTMYKNQKYINALLEHVRNEKAALRIEVIQELSQVIRKNPWDTPPEVIKVLVGLRYDKHPKVSEAASQALVVSVYNGYKVSKGDHWTSPRWSALCGKLRRFNEKLKFIEKIKHLYDAVALDVSSGGKIKVDQIPKLNEDSALKIIKKLTKLLKCGNYVMYADWNIRCGTALALNLILQDSNYKKIIQDELFYADYKNIAKLALERLPTCDLEPNLIPLSPSFAELARERGFFAQSNMCWSGFVDQQFYVIDESNLL